MATYIAAVSPVEANLMSRVQARQEEAFGELYTRFRSRIYRTALRILQEDQSAQDALQETLLHIHRGARKFRGDSRLATWINRITVNVCLEMIRKNKKRDQHLDQDISENTNLTDPAALTPFDETRRAEVCGRVRRALDRVGDKHRDVVRLHDLEGLTIREIALRLEVAEGTVKSRLFYGREALKKELIN